MKRRLLSLLLFLFAMSASSVSPQTGRTTTTVTRGSGGSIQTPLDYGIVVNKGSSLSREWITVHDSACPIALVDNVGVTTIYVRDRVSGEYNYSAKFSVEASEPVSAFEARFLLFDLWGNHLKTLSMTQVADLEGKKEVSAKWNAYSENEVSEYYASIAFVARVRTQTGRVFESNMLPVLEEARKISRKFSPENLEPKSQKP